MKNPSHAALILASASPIRAALLKAAGVSIDQIPAALDEPAWKAKLPAGTPLETIALSLAQAKAQEVGIRYPGRWVLGADQLAEQDGERIDKAQDLAALRQQLQRLRGRRHRLISAASLWRNGKRVWDGVQMAELDMRPFSEVFLEAYLAECGAAALSSVGGYQLEGPGIQLFSRINGDYFTILGLPLLPLLAALREAGMLME